MRKLMALGLGIVLMLSGYVVGQEEELPPPRRGTPQRRAQRGERLRRLADPAGPLGQLLESLNGGEGGNAPALDMSKVNEGIVALLQPLLDEEGGLEYLRLRFDPAETNLARDTVHLIGAARLRKSAWSNQPTQVDLDLHGTMQRRPDGRPVGVLDGGLRFQTEVVALANRAMTRFADRLDRRAQQGSVRDGPLPAEEAFRQRMREKLASTPPLESMDDVIDLILSFSGLRLTSINDRISELKAEVASATDDKARADLTAQLDAARNQRDQMLDLRPQIDRDDVGRAVAMHLSMDRSRVDTATKVERLRVEITERTVTIELVGNTMQGMELYTIAKPLVLNTLTRIQARDPNTAQLGRGMVRGYLRQFRDGIGGPDELGPPSPPTPPAPLPAPPQ